MADTLRAVWSVYRARGTDHLETFTLSTEDGTPADVAEQAVRQHLALAGQLGPDLGV